MAIMNVFNAHGFFNLLAWGILADAGLMLVRIWRSRKTYFNYQRVHYLAMVLLFIFFAIGLYDIISAGYAFVFEISTYPGLTLHKLIGLLICGILVVQMILGLITYSRLRSFVSTEFVHKVRVSHKLAGYVVYGFSRLNFLLGAFSTFQNPEFWSTLIPIYLFVSTSLHIYVYINYQKTYKAFDYNTDKFVESQNPTHQGILQALEEGRSRNEICQSYPTTRWVVYGNRVYDVTNWIHPGGNFLIQAVNGREISRFLHGAYGLESTDMDPHAHSAYALKVLENFLIGRLRNSESVLVPQIDIKMNESVLARKASNLSQISSISSFATNNLNLPLIIELDGPVDESSKKKKWKLVKREEISKNMTRFDMRCHDYKVKVFGSSVSYFGRHFIVSFAGKFIPTRTYTTCLSLSPERTELRNRLIKHFERRIAGHNDEFEIPEHLIKDRDVLSFYIRKYNFPNGFSKQIHDLDMTSGSEHNFVVQGPVGRGLEMTDNYCFGTHYILCAGSGVLPFLDLLDYLLWMTVLDVLQKKDKAGNLEEKMKILGFKFSQTIKSMKIKMIASFGSLADAYGFDITRKLAEISKKHDVNRFSLDMNNFSDEYIQKVPQALHKEILEKRIDRNAEAYYVCGPPKFNKDIPNCLYSLNIPREKILLI